MRNEEDMMIKVSQRKNELYIRSTLKRIQKVKPVYISSSMLYCFILYSLNKNQNMFANNNIDVISANMKGAGYPSYFHHNKRFTSFIEVIVSILSIKYGPGTAGIRVHCWDGWRHSKNWYKYYINAFFVEYKIKWNDFHNAVIKSYMINYL